MPYPMKRKKTYDYCPACGDRVQTGKDYKNTKCCSKECNQWMNDMFTRKRRASKRN